jgi:sugar phosphate isomerase/epimerase
MKLTLHCHERTPAAVAGRARALGVEHVSIYCDVFPEYDRTGIVPLEPLREYVGRVRDRGIDVAGALKWTGRDPGYVLDPGSHRRHVDAMLETVRNLGAAGIDTLLHYVDPEAPADLADDERAWAGLVEIYRELVPEAEGAGVRLAHHAIWMFIPPDMRDEVAATGVARERYRTFQYPNWPGPFLLRSADDVRRLVDAVPSPNNGVCLCTGMDLMGGDLPDLIEQFAGRIHYAQLRDHRGRWPSGYEVFPGTGEVDLAGTLERLRAVGYAGPVSPEHYGRPRHPGEDLEAGAIACTRDLLAAAGVR